MTSSDSNATSEPAKSGSTGAAPAAAGPPWMDSFKEVAKTIVYAVLLAVGFRSVAYEPFNIPSESMLPGLLTGDYLFVSKFSYGYSRHSFPMGIAPINGRIFDRPVERGDVVVFKWPWDNSTDYIKRIIGTPGDIIQMRGGTLYLNGQALRKERVADFEVEVSPNTNCRGYSEYQATRPDGTQVCRYPQYRETLPGGRSYLTLDLMPNGSKDDTAPYIVPQGHYFGMGDNRDNSQDSRVPISSPVPGVGYIPEQNIVGKAQIIFFSTDGSARLFTPWQWPTATRWDRLFSRIK